MQKPPLQSQHSMMKLRTPLLVTLLLFGAAHLYACGDDDNDAGTSDVFDSDSSNEDGGDETDTRADGEVSELADEIGQPCSSDSDCSQSGFCVQIDASEDGFCSIRCFADEECPTAGEVSSEIDFTCEPLPITNDELEFACVGDDFCYDPDEDQYGFGPGCPLIGFDCDQSNPDINPGAPERCDAIDRNCNGFFADAVIFAAGTATCIVDENIGQCRAGQRICTAVLDEAGIEVDVATDCVANIEPGSSVERCNGVDDDCDGVADDMDEDIIGQGQPCSTGATECIDGQLVCDPEQRALVCEILGEGSVDGEEPNVCDGRDNNCDGRTDENFKNEDGLYATIEHCGACNVNCVQQLPGSPEDLNVTALCNVTSSSATCGFQCNDGFIDADNFDENGCEFSPDTDATYVAIGGSDSGSCGTYNSPCATIARGITRAQSTGHTKVRIGEGAFPEAVSVANGVSLLGGHNARTWTRNTGAFVTSVTGSMDVGRDTTAVFAENISNPTEISGITFIASPAPAGSNSVGLLIRNSNENLSVTDNQIFAADGGSGSVGNSGESGNSGTNGAGGKPSIYVSNGSDDCGSAPNAGGSGGSNTCADLRNGGNVNVSGGAGATTERCAKFQETHPDAPSGNGPNPGSGGVTATDSFISAQSDPDVDFDCTVPGGDREFQTSGTSGQPGSDGTGGAGASDADGSVNASWVGQNGSVGQHGTVGSGGGGGGGAPNAEYGNTNSKLYIGASGGGGGAGGCAGARGNAGNAGGGSFAIFISGGSAPSITDNLLARGQAGNGGEGGNGGAGGAQGLGADGGPRNVGGGDDVDCVEAGQAGGDGGRGGHGGAGGGGAGGISFDIALSGVSGSQNYGGSNDFNLPGGTSTGGFGGDGGTSPSIDGSGSSIGNGGDGANGTSGAIISF